LDRTVGVISVIPRDEVTAFKVVRYPYRRSLARGWGERSILSGNGGAAVTRQVAARKERALIRFRTVRTNSAWVYPPIVPAKAALFAIDQRQAEFFDGKPHGWTGGRPDVALNEILIDPQMYVGRVVRTTGRVTRGTSGFVVVRPHKRVGQREAQCVYVPRGRASIRANEQVRLRALVVGWGTFKTRNHTDISDVTALQCANVSVMSGRLGRGPTPKLDRG